MKKALGIIGLTLGSIYILVLLGCAASQRKLLYHPSHDPSISRMTPWIKDGGIVGYYRETKNPAAIWLMTHGNAGQASVRDYALHCFPDSDSVYILEYPGFGLRAGDPSMDSMNKAALEMYLDLRKQFPEHKIGVVGESIGSGPASYLCSLPNPPDKLALVVPFNKLSDVAADHLPFLPVSLILKDNWNNLASLKSYTRPIDIFGAEDDRVIKVSHARQLATGLPNAKFHLISGGHNDWSYGNKVAFKID